MGNMRGLPPCILTGVGQVARWTDVSYRYFLLQFLSLEVTSPALRTPFNDIDICRARSLDAGSHAANPVGGCGRSIHSHMRVKYP